MEKELNKTTIIDGKKIAAQIEEEIAGEVNKITPKLGRPPHLVAITGIPEAIPSTTAFVVF